MRDRRAFEKLMSTGWMDYAAGVSVSGHEGPVYLAGWNAAARVELAKPWRFTPSYRRRGIGPPKVDGRVQVRIVSQLEAQIEGGYQTVRALRAAAREARR